MAKKYQTREIKVKEYVEEYNSTHEEQITRQVVYKMISNGELKAHKGEHNAWIIELKEEIVKEYSVKEFVSEYNRIHPRAIITEKKVRELASNGSIKARKKWNKWVILESPRRLIKCKY